MTPFLGTLGLDRWSLSGVLLKVILDTWQPTVVLITALLNMPRAWREGRGSCPSLSGACHARMMPAQPAPGSSCDCFKVGEGGGLTFGGTSLPPIICYFHKRK